MLLFLVTMMNAARTAYIQAIDENGGVATTTTKGEHDHDRAVGGRGGEGVIHACKISGLVETA